jgi:AcrR family transcriptional regulator
MSHHLQVNLNTNLFLKNPEQSVLGQEIIEGGLALMVEIGYEKFTFKKLAQKIATTEASIYRYFENKHLFLNYLTDLYWTLLSVNFTWISDLEIVPSQKLDKMMAMLIEDDLQFKIETKYSLNLLKRLCIQEVSKTFLSIDVDQLNANKIFQPIKDVIYIFSKSIKEMNPDYSHQESLSSLVILGAIKQLFIMEHLPRLSSFSDSRSKEELKKFMVDIIQKTLKK